MLPAASYALPPNLKKGLFFHVEEGSRFFYVCFLHARGQIFLYQTPGRPEGGSDPLTDAPRSAFSTHSWTNVFVSDAWPAPTTYHRPCCEHCDQRVGRSP